jgi:hypothetical protein
MNNKDIAKLIIFDGYVRLLDNNRLEAEYKQQCFMAEKLLPSGLTFFPLKDALAKEIDRRNTIKVG